MNRIEDLRLFYNHTIQPELLRLEHSRRRLIQLLIFSGLSFVVIAIVTLAINILPLTLFLCIPIAIYIAYLLRKIRAFQLRFKPYVMKLVLDFLDNDIYYGTLEYDAEKEISKEHFQNSHLFATEATEFDGEDYIHGRIGELMFELCELEVNEMSKVRNRVDTVFRGVFLHSKFEKEMTGDIIIIPRELKAKSMRSIKRFTRNGATEIKNQQVHDLGFDEYFVAYASANANVAALLSSGMQAAILGYHERTKCAVSVSFIGSDIYVAVDEPNDLLEPFLIQSNVSFDLILSYYEKIELLLSIVRDFDLNN